MQQFYYTTTQKNNELLIHDGFLYTLRRETGDTKHWRCRNRHCHGILQIKDRNIIISSTNHMHNRDQKKINNLLLNMRIKNTALTTTNKAAEVVLEEIQNLEDFRLCEMPPIKYLRDIITKTRTKKLFNATSKYDDIPSCLKKTLKGDIFIRSDTGVNDELRIIIFLGENGIKWIEKCKKFIIDGTFYSVPRDFCQLVTVHGEIFGRFVPLCYCLLKSKNLEIYVRLFKQLKEYKFDPLVVTIDFEQAIKHALEEIFTNVKVYGCAFHMSQNLWKKIQKLRLVSDYKNNDKFKELIRMYFDLTFFPVESLGEALEFIDKQFNDVEIGNKHEYLKFKKYFIETYIGLECNSNVKAPLYKSSFWNCHGRIISRIPRTTNIAEAWHRHLNTFHETAHPNIGKLISSLQKDEEKVRINLLRWSNGIIEMARVDYILEEKLFIAAINYGNYDVCSYFKLIRSIYTWKIGYD